MGRMPVDDCVAGIKHRRMDLNTMGCVASYYDITESDFSEDEEENNLYNAVLSGNWEKIVNALFTNDLDSPVTSIYHEYCLNKIDSIDIHEIPYSYLWNMGGDGMCEVSKCECSSITPIVKLFTTCDVVLIRDLIKFNLLIDEDIDNDTIVDLFFFFTGDDRYNFTLALLELIPLARLIGIGILFKRYEYRNSVTIIIDENNFLPHHRIELQKVVKAKFHVDEILTIRTAREF